MNSVLACWDCHNKMPQTQGLKERYSFSHSCGGVISSEASLLVLSLCLHMVFVHVCLFSDLLSL